VTSTPPGTGARMTRRLNAGEILSALGATLLLVSLFLDWYEPGLSSWTVFELIDITLAAIAVGTLVSTVADWLGRPTSLAGERALTFLAGGALVIVAASLIDPPPAALNSTPEAGGWLALGGAILMLAGSLLRDVRLSIVIAPREEIDQPLDAYAGDEPYADDEPVAPSAETERFDTEPR
jgi:hypothetical protein